FKMAMITSGPLYHQIETGKNSLWRSLPLAVAGKYKIVRRDPFETGLQRVKLNLGHTMGHVLESAHKIPHGIAVGLGLIFCLEWSHQRQLLPLRSFLKM